MVSDVVLNDGEVFLSVRLQVVSGVRVSDSENPEVKWTTQQQQRRDTLTNNQQIAKQGLQIEWRWSMISTV